MDNFAITFCDSVIKDRSLIVLISIMPPGIITLDTKYSISFFLILKIMFVIKYLTYNEISINKMLSLLQ